MQTNEGACTKGTQLIYTQEKVGLKKQQEQLQI